jgi:hypothetical protein
MDGAEVDRTLEFLNEYESDLRLILTVSAKHLCAFAIAREYSEVIARHGNAGFCFVAGNSAFLSEEERRLDLRSRIRELVRLSRDRLPYAPIFVGSEGLTDLTVSLSQQYSTVPFMLLDSSVRENAEATRSKSREATGVYCPCHLSADGDGGLIKSFGAYALRRRWVRKALRDRGFKVSDIKTQIADGGVMGPAATLLGSAVRKLALCGFHAAEEHLRVLENYGVHYAALLSAEEDVEEAKELEKLASRFCS